MLLEKSDFKPIAKYIKRQAEIRRDEVAVRFGQDNLSYGDLDRKSDKIAAYLIQEGVVKNTCIGLMTERSLELVTVLLGILKSGAAYLPIDPDTPVSRARQLLRDGSVTHVFCSGDMECLPPTKVVNVKHLEQVLADIESSEPFVSVSPADLISVFFTSGSTGTPKGVLSSHEGWLNRMEWMQDYYNLKPGETVLQKTTISFDDSAVELLWPLMYGGVIALMPPDLHRDPRAIIDCTVHYGVKVLHFVPSMLVEVLKFLTPADISQLRCLKQVISSGEALHPNLVKEFQESLPHCDLFNQWGATEASIDTTIYRCDSEEIKQYGKVPLGEAIANNRIYVLDSELNPVSDGGIGELYIAGVGLGLGYLNDPYKTTEAFVPDPFHSEERMYKTGDLASVEQNNVFFLGRQDSQIKIRGNRVELQEIEATICRHESVENTAVTATKDENGYKIIGFYKSTETISSEDLISYVSDFLPSYMIPARFINVLDFPLTASGKINKQALTAVSKRPALNTPYSRPQTARQVELIKIFENVLELQGLGIDDGFVFLGGHSLDAIRIASRIESGFKVRIPPMRILENTTVRSLERLLEELNGEAFDFPAICRTTDQSCEGLIMSNAQERMLFLHQIDPTQRLGALLVFELTGNLDVDALRKSFQLVYRQNEALQMAFVEKGGEHRPVVDPEGSIDFELRDVQSDSELQINKLINDVYLFEYRLDVSPLWRVRLLKHSSQKHQLLFSIHPIITDGWSNGLIFDQVTEHYNRLINGEAPGSNQETYSYSDYCRWVRTNLETPYFFRQRDYWLNKIREPVSISAFPACKEKNPADADGNEIFFFEIGGDQRTSIYNYIKNRNITLYVFLLSILKVFIHRATDLNTVTVCTPLSGRTHPILEKVVGSLVNPTVLISHFHETQIYSSFLTQLNTTVNEALENQSYPFDLLYNHLRESGQETPLYNMVFVVQNYQIKLSLAGVESQAIFMSEQLKPAGTLKDIDLHIEAFELKDSITLRVEFNREYLSQSDISRFCNSWSSLIYLVLTGRDLEWSDFDACLIDNGIERKNSEDIKLTEDELAELF